jgi:hypothetical protein
VSRSGQNSDVFELHYLSGGRGGIGKRKDAFSAQHQRPELANRTKV